MNTAKPSIPSSDGGAADDLIEELARLMAEGAQEKSLGAPARAPAALQTGPSSGAGAGLSRFAAGKTGVVSPMPLYGGAKYEAAKTAPAASSPAGLSAASSSPETGNVKPAGQTGSDFNFGIAASRPDRLEAPAPQPQIPLERGFGRPDTGEKREPVFGKSAAPAFVAPTPRVEEPKTPAPDDPIGEIIRAQSLMDPGTGGSAPDDNHAGAGPGGVALPEPALEPGPGTPKPDGMDKTDGLPGADSLRKTDSFKVSPVFGLSGKVADPVLPVTPPHPVLDELAASAPDGKSIGRSDALDEIESLIGNAIRVDFSQDDDASSDGSGAQQAAEGPDADQGASLAHDGEPALSPPAPTPQGGSIDSAEDAILQAMAAAGRDAHELGTRVGAKPSRADIGGAKDRGTRVVPDEQSEAAPASDSNEADQTADRRISRFLVPLGAGIILIAAIAGGYWVLNSGADNADAPVLVADSTPSKQAVQPAEESSGGQSAVFSETEGNVTGGENERLVSRDQASDLIGNEIRKVITSENTEAGLANRRVRTVTVRPDGTIISGETAVAGGEVLPVERPNVPELPASALDPELSNTVVAALPEALAASEAPSPVSASPPGMTAPVPQPRPASRGAVLTPQAAQNTSTQPQIVADTGVNNNGAVDLITGMPVSSPEQLAPTTPASISATPVANPGAWVQMASRRSEEAAAQSAAELQTRYASVLGGRQLQIKRVDLGDRGVFYRVLLASATLSEASSICSAVQGAGGDCFTRNN